MIRWHHSRVLERAARGSQLADPGRETQSPRVPLQPQLHRDDLPHHRQTERRPRHRVTHPRRGGAAFRPRARRDRRRAARVPASRPVRPEAPAGAVQLAPKDREAIAKQCGTSVKMLERSYSIAIEDFGDETPKPAEEERLRARQLALAGKRELRVARARCWRSAPRVVSCPTSAASVGYAWPKQRPATFLQPPCSPKPGPGRGKYGKSLQTPT